MGKRLVDSQDVDDIEREGHSEQEMRDKLFEVWKRRRGSGATYRVVMKAFNDVKNQQAAEMLKDLLSSIPQGRQCMPYLYFHVQVLPSMINKNCLLVLNQISSSACTHIINHSTLVQFSGNRW